MVSSRALFFVALALFAFSPVGEWTLHGVAVPLPAASAARWQDRARTLPTDEIIADPGDRGDPNHPAHAATVSSVFCFRALHLDSWCPWRGAHHCGIRERSGFGSLSCFSSHLCYISSAMFIPCVERGISAAARPDCGPFA